MASADSAGIMSGAFFVSKGDLLKWINDFFGIGYTKVEECASGALHCQILDSIFRNVPLHKVNFLAKSDYEFIPNFKVLQDVFAKQGIQKHVDVDKLIKAKYQDNLEFLQWIKHLWDTRYDGEEYDAVARREEAMKKRGQKPPTAKPAGDKKVAPAKKIVAPAPAVKKPPPKSAEAKKPAAAPAKKAAAPAVHAEDADTSTSGGDAATAAQIAHLNEKLTKLKITIEGLEKERNFYFGKLREIEVLCQTEEDKDSETKAKILEILYKTDDDFTAPEAPAEEAEQVEQEAEQEAPADEEQPADDQEVLQDDEDATTF